MGLGELLQLLRDEAAVITGAPFLSAMLFLAGVVVSWFVVKHLHEARLAIKDATIENLTARVEDYSNKLIDPPSAIPPKDDEYPPRPTLEMLEAGRREQQAKREQLVDSWRAMVAYANHQAGQAGETRTDVEIVESDPRFMSLRGRLTDKSKNALRGKPMVLDGSLVPETISYPLQCILDDINALEQEWRLV